MVSICKVDEDAPLQQQNHERMSTSTNRIFVLEGYLSKELKIISRTSPPNGVAVQLTSSSTQKVW